MQLFRFILAFIMLSCFSSFAQENEIPKLKNPISANYLKRNLTKTQPRLVLDAKLEKKLKKKIKTDPVMQNMYNAVKLNAESIYNKPLLERKKIGKRLLHISREMLYRVNMLALVYRVEKDPKVLARINDEVFAVCNFSDWNPSHFLDVAEMSLAVSLALDWTAGDLPESTIKLAKLALIEKGIKPSWPEGGNYNNWVYTTNNWNQVCNGGLIAAALTIADIDPELAAKTISRALNGLPHALAVYMPDGIYPEGSTYWYYGTSFTVTTIAMLESALGTDFGISAYPGFMKSAEYRCLMNAPSGIYYNYYDCWDTRDNNGDMMLAWFAARTGNKGYFEKERFLQKPENMETLTRLGGVAMVWLSQYEEKGNVELPSVWKGDGINPLIVFKDRKNATNGYYLGAKGGKAENNHANMDAGSFVFEVNGVRWVIDPGNQDYYELEKTGFDLWNKNQNSQRWTLLTKNNVGHSTITINDSLHKVDGFACITDFKDGDKPQATFNLTPVFGDLVEKATRSFIKDSPTSVTIEDEIIKSPKTESITWQLMTTAAVEIVDGGAILRKDGKTLKIENLSHPKISMSVISLDPAPLALDKQIPGLKRLELKIPAWTISGDKTTIKVRLNGNN